MKETVIDVKDLSIGYEKRVVLHDLNFSVSRGKFFVSWGAPVAEKAP